MNAYSTPCSKWAHPKEKFYLDLISFLCIYLIADGNSWKIRQLELVYLYFQKLQSYIYLCNSNLTFLATWRIKSKVTLHLYLGKSKSSPLWVNIWSLTNEATWLWISAVEFTFWSPTITWNMASIRFRSNIFGPSNCEDLKCDCCLVDLDFLTTRPDFLCMKNLLSVLEEKKINK